MRFVNRDRFLHAGITAILAAAGLLAAGINCARAEDIVATCQQNYRGITSRR